MRKWLILSVFVVQYVVSMAVIKTVFLIPFSHLDIGFTASQSQVQKLYIKMFDELPNYLEHFPEFKFTIETVWQFKQWLDNNPEPEKIQKIVGYVKSGRIEFGAAFANMHTGFQNKLSLAETFLFAKDILNNYSITPTVCLMDDVPGYAADLPDVLSEQGIRFFMSGINDKYAGILRSPWPVDLFYWEGPKGGRVLTWISKYSYMEGILIRSPSALEEYVSNLEQSGYPYDAVAVLLATDNGGVEPALVNFLRLSQSVYDKFEVVASTPKRFFEYMERKYQEDVPIYKGDWSGAWEKVKTSAPYFSSMIRWCQDMLEDLLNQGALSRTSALYRSVIEDILQYCEHSSSCGAGWPGFLTYDQTLDSNQTVACYALEAYSGLMKLLQMNSLSSIEENAFTVFVRAGSSEVAEVKVPTKLRCGSEIAILEINGDHTLAWSFTNAATNTYDPFREGFKAYVKLPPGFYVARLKDRICVNPAAEKTATIENSFYRVTVNSDGTFNIFDKTVNDVIGENMGSLMFSYTNNEYCRKKVDSILASSFVEKHGLEKTLIEQFSGDTPLLEMKITLPERKKIILLDYLIDRAKFPFVPYKKHSLNYYLIFPLSFEGDFVYFGPGSLVRHPSAFPAVRSREIAINGICGFESKSLTYTFGSREAFMVECNGSSLVFHIMRHYSETATKDRGIACLAEVEPGAPSVLRYSFAISTEDYLNVQIMRNFLQPSIAFK